ncbi:MAG: hypothetical protein K2Q18_06570 [Bdellovibrionales bacterium]|nr:hypothetical protein [Bdellovibrionales bacterium]
MNYEAFETFARVRLESHESDINQPTRVSVPESAYRPVKRCPNCQSVYLSDTKCDDCGRSLLYHPIGEPFSAKSLYGIKERYHDSFNLLLKYYPVFENKKGVKAQSYIRNLTKRFDSLLSAFSEEDAIKAGNRRFFYVEMLELMDELQRFGVNSLILHQKIEGSSEKIGSLLSQELLLYLGSTKNENTLSPSWKEIFLNHRIMGGRIEYWMRLAVVTATILFVAVNFYSLISSQVGR